MFRFVIRFILLLIFFGVIRYAIGTVARFFSNAMGSRPVPARQAPQTTGMRSAGELRQDPVCGTFVPVGSSLTKTVKGEVMHFCSPACRDKFKVA